MRALFLFIAAIPVVRYSLPLAGVHTTWAQAIIYVILAKLFTMFINPERSVNVALLPTQLLAEEDTEGDDDLSK